MRVLLLNTAGAQGVVALAEDDRVVAEEWLPGRGTSEALMSAVRRVLGEERLGGVGAVGVVIGPGSFTGTRVGLAAAKGLCEAAGVGIVAMSRLELVARAAGMGVAVLDGGRGEYYCGVSAAQEGDAMTEDLVSAETVREKLRGRAGVSCEAGVSERLAIALVEEPGAALMLAEVQRRLAMGAWSDVALLDANYLRRTDAERKAGVL